MVCVCVCVLTLNVHGPVMVSEAHPGGAASADVLSHNCEAFHSQEDLFSLSCIPVQDSLWIFRDYLDHLTQNTNTSLPGCLLSFYLLQLFLWCKLSCDALCILHQLWRDSSCTGGQDQTFKCPEVGLKAKRKALGLKKYKALYTSTPI